MNSPGTLTTLVSTFSGGPSHSPAFVRGVQQPYEEQLKLPSRPTYYTYANKYKAGFVVNKLSD